MNYFAIKGVWSIILCKMTCLELIKPSASNSCVGKGKRNNRKYLMVKKAIVFSVQSSLPIRGIGAIKDLGIC